jgi:hypothetical protein
MSRDGTKAGDCTPTKKGNKTKEPKEVSWECYLHFNKLFRKVHSLVFMIQTMELEPCISLLAIH